MMQPHTAEPRAAAPARRDSRTLASTAVFAVVGSAVRVLALFSVVNLALGLAVLGGVRHWVWINLHDWPPGLAVVWIAAFSAGVLAWPHLRGPAAAVARALVASAAVACSVDVGRFYIGYVRGDFASALPVPLSLVAALVLGAWAWRPPAVAAPFTPGRFLRVLVLDVALAGLGLLGLCVAFGASDYRRPADAIVVYGAGVQPDGSPSLALADRTRTACRLFRQGLARHLVLSGGPREPAAMMRVVREMGIPVAAVIRDETGVNTLATVKNCAALAAERGWSSLLMVSHDYHLARIKMFCARERLEAYTVPAEETRPLASDHYFRLRELAALVAYYFLPQLSAE